jgi:hypothetical protein
MGSGSTMLTATLTRHEACARGSVSMRTPGSSERGRQNARVVPIGEVTVSVQGSELQMELWDLSLGGFAIRCARPFHNGMTHRFVFAVPSEGRSVTLVAKAVHSYAAKHATKDPANDREALSFVSGWEFMSARSQEDQAAISRLFLAAAEPRVASPLA